VLLRILSIAFASAWIIEGENLSSRWSAHNGNSREIRKIRGAINIVFITMFKL
jgi:hypothetical protein